MISVLIQSLFTAICILAYHNGADPEVAMLCIGWCSAFTFVSIVKAIAKEVRS